MRTLLILTMLCVGCGPASKEQVSAAYSCAGPRLTPPAPVVLGSSVRFLVAGQSNAVSPAQMHADYYSQTGLLTMNDPYGDDSLRVPTAIEPFHGGIAWIYFADLLNMPVIIRNVAEANTTTRKWRDYLHQRLASALQADQYDAVLWVQGESDIGENVPMEEACYNLKYVIQKSWEVRPGLTWYIALNSAQNKPDNNPIREAQRAVIAQGYALQGPDTDVIRTNASMVELGGGEFVGAGLQEHGSLWAAVFGH